MRTAKEKSPENSFTNLEFPRRASSMVETEKRAKEPTRRWAAACQFTLATWHPARRGTFLHLLVASRSISRPSLAFFGRTDCGTAKVEHGSPVWSRVGSAAGQASAYSAPASSADSDGGPQPAVKVGSPHCSPIECGVQNDSISCNHHRCRAGSHPGIWEWNKQSAEECNRWAGFVDLGAVK